MSTSSRALLLIGCVVLCQLAGISGAAVTGDTTWYPRPSFHPPNWLFGPAWVTIYALMGASLYLLITSPANRERTAALVLFSIQLLLNAAWTPAFFGLRSPGLALVVIVMLWIAIIAWTLRSHRVRPAAAWLSIPYIGWVTFAMILNLAIWRMT
jgi:translocator protein